MTRKQRLEATITQHIETAFLSVEDESRNHHVPEGSESHFKLIIVADAFQPMTRIARHRLINNLMANELNSGLHALSLHLYTPEEWKVKEAAVPRSPACRDGFQE